MSASVRATLVIALLTITSASAVAQFGGGSLSGTSVGVSVNSPMGKFANQAQTGFGVVVHTGGESGDAWSGRSTFAIDRFVGKGSLDNVQFIGGGLDFVHRSTGWYQFAGILASSTTYSYKDTPTVATETRLRNGSNFGFTGGIGATIGSRDGTHGFVEVGATLLFTGNTNSSWVPVRLGIQF